MKQDLIRTEQSLVERRLERRTAAGAALLFGAGSGAIRGLEDTEREAERSADSLRAAIELAEAEVRKLEEAARQARLEALRERRAVVALEIRRVAGAVDKLFAEAAEQLQMLDQLMMQFRTEGGVFVRSLKGCATRAALATGMRPYLETEFVGGHDHLRPLAEQLGTLATAGGPTIGS